jgi:signal transduction histidine kinase
VALPQDSKFNSHSKRIRLMGCDPHANLMKPLALSNIQPDRLRAKHTDAGRGFDPELANPNAGIGLAGMRERLRLVGGRFSLMTEVMRGTETLVEVPLSAPANEAQLIAQVARGLES